MRALVRLGYVKSAYLPSAFEVTVLPSFSVFGRGEVHAFYFQRFRG